jgi:hypothetical protein
MTVDAVIALHEDQQIEAKIAAKEQDLQAAQRVAQLQQRAGLVPVTVPVFPAAFAELLAKTFATVSADAERLIGEHIARHAMQASGETWLTEGLLYVVSDECPFCGQGLAGLDLIQAYRCFFSSEYHALREEVTSLSGEVDNAIGDRVSAAINQTVLQNDSSLEFWRQYCEIAPLAPVEAGSVGEVMMALRLSAQSLLRVKVGTPLDAVAPDAGFTQALTTFEALRTSLATYRGCRRGECRDYSKEAAGPGDEYQRRGNCSCSAEGTKSPVYRRPAGSLRYGCTPAR